MKIGETPGGNPNVDPSAKEKEKERRGVNRGLREAWKEEFAQKEILTRPDREDVEKEKVQNQSIDAQARRIIANTIKEKEGEEKLGSILDGRAEFEKVGEMALFESKRPTEMYPWTKESGFGIGFIIADRGTGKTFFIRKLIQELAKNGKRVEIKNLDKINLKWAGNDIESPDFIVFDDLHYLIQAMRQRQLKGPEAGKPVIESSEVLRILEDGIKRAKETNAKIVFVSDEDICDLYTRFEDKAEQKKFVEIMRDAGMSDEIFDRFRQSREETKGPGVLKFREKLDGEALVKMRMIYKMFDIPFLEPSGKGVAIGKDSGRVVYPEMEAEGRLHKTHEFDPGEFILTESSVFVNKENKFDFPGKKPIIRSRELSALKKILGAVNRETLGLDALDIGKKSEWINYTRYAKEDIMDGRGLADRPQDGGWFYTDQEAEVVRKLIEAAFRYLTQRRGEQSEAWALLNQVSKGDTIQDDYRKGEEFYLDRKMAKE